MRSLRNDRKSARRLARPKQIEIPIPFTFEAGQKLRYSGLFLNIRLFISSFVFLLRFAVGKITGN